jgi:D-serine deaminase-like pyridoxal phosphate-dependent protein
MRSDAEKRWSVHIMVDCGYHRDGVDPAEEESVKLAKAISCGQACGRCAQRSWLQARPGAEAANRAYFQATSLGGIYTHAGHSYDSKGQADVVKVAEAERDAVASFAASLRQAGISCPTVGVGSTPTASHPPSNLSGCNELHPGNYLCYDWMQHLIGSCASDDIAVRVAARVIGHNQKLNFMLIDLGWTGCTTQGAEHSFGHIMNHPGLKVKKLKQEAGEVVSTDGSAIDFSRYPIGSMLLLAPWHACAAISCHSKLHAVRGEQVLSQWTSVKGW